MTEEILLSYAHKIKDLTLLPSSGGIFEVAVDGELIFNKAEQDRFPEKGEMLRTLKERLAPK